MTKDDVPHQKMEVQFI